MFITHLPPIDQGQTCLAQPQSGTLSKKGAANNQILDPETALSSFTTLEHHGSRVSHLIDVRVFTLYRKPQRPRKVVESCNDPGNITQRPGRAIDPLRNETMAVGRATSDACDWTRPRTTQGPGPGPPSHSCLQPLRHTARTANVCSAYTDQDFTVHDTVLHAFCNLGLSSAVALDSDASILNLKN